MSSPKILFDKKDHAKSPIEISQKIVEFGDSYNNAVKEIINDSKVLDRDGKVFIKCASHILSNFKMTRRGTFHANPDEILQRCWDTIGVNLLKINCTVRTSGLLRDRYLLELNPQVRQDLIAEIWQITKKLLPFTMGKTSYGLVGASKILFSVLPEIVLPVDNTEWSSVFQTVDLGDVIHYMVSDIQKWEEITGKQLNQLDPTKRLSTLPSVYNVMAMAARTKDL